MRQAIDQFERALDGRDRLQRMDVGETRQPRQLFVEPRVVLHRARAERIEAGVDRIVLVRQPGEMANHLRLAETGQTDRALPLETAHPGADGRRLRQVDAATTRRILLEDQRLLDLETAVAAHGRGPTRRRFGAACRERPTPFAHDSASRSPCSSRSASSAVAVSVTATSRRCANSGRSG